MAKKALTALHDYDRNSGLVVSQFLGFFAGGPPIAQKQMVTFKFANRGPCQPNLLWLPLTAQFCS
ncbi:MAG TPA: hypothetical protein DCE44_00345 [Verrucomicrobiales bacterium]|nr:hypothetical protein [Verrucomicrobiales bacterium]